jgi:uracil-DNA glycosylase
MIQSLEDLVSGKKLSHNRVKVPPVGPSSAEVMLIGEAPGASEETSADSFRWTSRA